MAINNKHIEQNIALLTKDEGDIIFPDNAANDIVSYERNLSYHYRNCPFSFSAVAHHMLQYEDEEKWSPKDTSNNLEVDQVKIDKMFKWLSKHLDSCLLVHQNSGSSISLVYKDLYDFELKARDKWVGIQGGTPSAQKVHDMVSAYYDKVTQYYDDFDEDTVISDNVFAEVLAALQDKHGLPNTVPVSHNMSDFSSYPRPSRASNSGVICFSDRRDGQVQLKNFIFFKRTNNRAIAPIVIGTRHMRNKYRIICMDALSNWYALYPYYTRLSNLFRNSYAVKYAQDDVLQYKHQLFCDKNNSDVLYFESDYESMDTWVSLKHANFVFKFMNHLCNEFTHEEMSIIRQLNNDIFNSHAITPLGIKTGLHNLFSGTLPTNYIETPLNLLINIQWLTDSVAKKLGISLHYGKDYIIFVLGDDVLIVFGSKAKKAIIESGIDLQKDFSEWVWQHYVILANPSKQRVSTSSGFFCKRQFSTSGAKALVYRPNSDKQYQVTLSRYPLTLVLNSILYPEDDQWCTKAQSLITLWQRLDNAFGHPGYKQFVIFVYNNFPQLQHICVSDEDINEYNSSRRAHWRIKVLGQKFDIRTSPSAQMWMKLDNLV